MHAPTRAGLEAFDKGMRLGLGTLSQMERDKINREDKEKRTKREEQEFEWKKEDREKKARYDVASAGLNEVKALKNAGKEQAALQKLSSVLTSSVPDGDEFMGLSKNVIPEAKWNSDPQLKGKQIALISKRHNVLPFKTFDEAYKYVSSKILDPKVFSQIYDDNQAKINLLNSTQKTFVGADGKTYIQYYKQDYSGSPVLQDPEEYKGQVPATDIEKRILGIKRAEKESGIKFTPEERKQYIATGKLGTKGKSVSPEKQITKYKKEMDFLLRRFVEKGKNAKGDWTEDITDEEGNPTEAGMNALDKAMSIVEKYQSGQKLNAKEKSLLPYAQRAVMYYEQKINEMMPVKRKNTSNNIWDKWRPKTNVQPVQEPMLGRQTRTPIQPQFGSMTEKKLNYHQ